MIYIRQLSQEIDKLIKVSLPAAKEFDDPFYIAWMVDTIFNGNAPSSGNQGGFVEIMEARKSTAFRAFWEQYKVCATVLGNFQVVGMGVISNDDRIRYQRKFMNEHSEEVPF